MEQTIHESLAPTAAEKTQNLASAQGVEWQDLGAPALADVDRIVNELDPIADGALSIIAQPDVPRSITVTVVDTNDSASGSILIVGKDFLGNLLTDTFAFGSGTKLWESTDCYAAVTTATVSGEAGAAGGDSIAVGIGTLIGLPKPIAYAGAIKYAWFNGAPVTPDAVSVGVLALSGVDASGGTYDGSVVLRVAYQPSA